MFHYESGSFCSEDTFGNHYFDFGRNRESLINERENSIQGIYPWLNPNNYDIISLMKQKASMIYEEYKAPDISEIQTALATYKIEKPVNY